MKMLKFKYRFESLADNYDIGESKQISLVFMEIVMECCYCVCSAQRTIFACTS